MVSAINKKRAAGYWLMPLAVALIFWGVDAASDATLLHQTTSSESGFALRYELVERTLVALLLGFAAFFVLKTRGASIASARKMTEMEEAKQLAEAQFQQQQSKTIVSERMRVLNEMGANLAHSLNQPLTGIRGMAEHLELGLEREWKIESEKTRSKLVGIREQADRIANIIDHIRTFAKEAEAPETQEVSLNDIILSCSQIFSAQLHYHSIGLNFELAENLPKVMANPFSLEEIIFALVSNARDSFQDRGVNPNQSDEPASIRLRTHAIVLDETRFVELEIADNGCGMTDEQAARAFELFFSAKVPNRATGLGLSVSKSIIEQLGGRIDLQTKVGSGTTVRIQLPALPGNRKNQEFRAK